jgi:hypothetical protein
VQKPICQADSKSLSIDQAQLAMLITGIDVSNIKRRKRFETKLPDPSSPS